MNVDLKSRMVFHNEHNGNTFYSISDSSKDLEGNYTNYSWNIRFKKGTEVPQDRSKINVKGFMNYYAKNDKTYVTIQCTEWSYETERSNQEVKEKFDPFANGDDSDKEEESIYVDTSELPF